MFWKVQTRPAFEHVKAQGRTAHSDIDEIQEAHASYAEEDCDAHRGCSQRIETEQIAQFSFPKSRYVVTRRLIESGLD